MLLFWNRPELNEALDILTVLGETFGLELRRDKCEVWSKEALNTIDSRIKINSKEPLETLSAAVGSPQNVASSIQKRVQKIEKLLEKLEYINDPQCSLGILRSCLGAPKMVYSMLCNTIRGSYKNFWGIWLASKNNLWEYTGNSLVQMNHGIKHVCLSKGLELESDERLIR